MTTTPYYSDDLVTLYHGDAETVAHALQPGSVRTIVTSPPYYGLRDYGEAEQIGAEETLHQYVDRLVRLFRILRSVLTDDGTLWLNLGDSYAGARGGSQGTTGVMSGRDIRNARRRVVAPSTDMPPKNLLGVPWQVAFALQDDGWILRSDIIWAKPNPMPESVTDRPTKSHEHIFMFAKSQRYYYDAAAIAEDAKVTAVSGSGPRFGGSKYGDNDLPEAKTKSGNHYQPYGNRNKRDVWTVATTPFPGSHFAVYPPELIRPCIIAGSATGDTVLDPFSGSGTTGMVATQEGRRYIGIDLNREYLDLSLRTRFAQPVLDMTGADTMRHETVS